MKTLVLGCRPTLPNVEAEVNAVVAAAPGAELLLDPTAEQAASRAPDYDACHFAGHANPKLGQDRVLVWCHPDGFAAVDASTLVRMLCKMKLVVLNGCKSVELGLKLRDAGVPYVVVWTTLLCDAAAELFAVRFWEELVKRNPDDELRVAVRKAFDEGKVAVQTAVTQSLKQGALDVGGGKTRKAAVPMYELHDPEDVATVEQNGPNRGRILSDAQKAGRVAAGVPLLLQAATMHGVPNLPEQIERRTELESEHRNALLRSPRMMAITATTTGVSGPAGVGKSTMATVLARDALVHAHFPDGITWLSFGRERKGAEVLQKFASQLRVELAPGDELREGINRALAGQRRLLVLDDIWTEEHRDAFSSLNAENGLLGRLVTTRSDELAGEHAQKVVALQDAEGLRVLASYMDVKQLTDDSAARRLVELCCGNPAMLRSVAALCKKRGTASTLDYLEKCREKLRLAKLPRAGDYEYWTLFDALAGSLDFLRGEDEQLAEKCQMLAAFPEDTHVPWFAVGQLWGVDELETENAVTELESWHLIDVDWTKRTISLIDLHLDYLRASAKADLAQWQAGLLQRCGRRKLGVNEGRGDDSYWGEDGRRHVLHHLTGCEPSAISTEIVEVNLSGLRIGSEGAMELARVLPQSKIERLKCAMGA